MDNRDRVQINLNDYINQPLTEKPILSASGEVM